MSSHAVIGCGIIGLTTVYELLKRGVDPTTITIIAEFFPGDQSINYASPYAGAYFTPFVDEVSYCRYTYENIEQLKMFIGGHSPGIKTTPVVEHLAEEMTSEDVSSIIEFIPDLELSDSDVPGCSAKVTFTGLTFNPPVLLANLLRKVKQAGVKTERKRLTTLDEVMAKFPVVFNCSGLGAASLANDEKVYPTRGQVVVVRDASISSVITAWRESDSTYIIPRPHSKTHEVILGGFYQPNVSTPHTFGEESEDIIKRTTELFPGLLESKSKEDLEIMRVVAGARPSRKGGPRIEKEASKHGVIFHNYGAGGSGYINSLGMAHKCVELYMSHHQ